ncbi:[Fe-S]-binding protein [bacterium]|nr:MAG: [Fe-S]-binding protein [bacterium]
MSNKPASKPDGWGQRLPELPDGGAGAPLQKDLLNGVSRRHFMQATGFAFIGTMMLGCTAVSEEEALPYLEQPEGVIAGRSDLYATTCGGCSAGCGMLARSRDGRPVKLEGNPDHPLSHGGLCAVGQASLLGLYDSHRLRAPVMDGKASDWASVDVALGDRLRQLRSASGRVAWLGAPITSPNKRARVEEFLATFDNGRLVEASANSQMPIAEAHGLTHGVATVPRYHFDRAQVIVSVDADFLGTWISPVEFTAAWSSRRRGDALENGFSEHVQFESRMSVTGTKADLRLRIAPGERAAVLNQLVRHLSQHAHRSLRQIQDRPLTSVDDAQIAAIAARLWEHRDQALVVCGADDLAAQTLCNAANELLGAYGKCLDLAQPAHHAGSSETELSLLLDEIAAGRIDALFVDGLNPVLDLPAGAALAQRLDAMQLVVSFSPYEDETSAHADFICPDHHYLESWSDNDNITGLMSYTQPIVAPMGATRQLEESLSMWTTGAVVPVRDQVLASSGGDVRRFDKLLHDGFEMRDVRQNAGNFRPDGVHAASDPDASGLQLVLYSKVAIPSSAHAFNPWLHELPDPVTKSVWDNYASLSPATAERLSLQDGDVVRVALGQDAAVEVPVLIQPGQHDSAVAVALGYGSVLSRRFEGVGPGWIERKPTVGSDGLVGASATAVLAFEGGRRKFAGRSVTVEATGARRELARTQDYHSLDVPPHLAPEGGERRPNVQETTVAALMDPHFGEHAIEHHDGGNMWPVDHPYEGHHWGMVIDLTLCTGCSACVTSCQVENNVPVVGKDEVRRNREMHWLRIDRYFVDRDPATAGGDRSNGTGNGDVDVSHQPMMCHHCDNAPCETVCPVLATVHSDEGLNQQVYNRCVGTRYCMNNCPYKVRRFNWFEYAHEDEHENLAMNPDVTIRSRGIMEKCSFCAQRIQEAKIVARQQRRPVADGDIRMACQQSCAAQAISFGDMNDPESAVARARDSRRHFQVLAEIGVQPSVGYTSLVRNRPTDHEGPQHG